MRWLSLAELVALLVPVTCLNFPFESIQLAEDDVKNFNTISFGDPSQPVPDTPCRSHPGSTDWPSGAELVQLNSSLGGSLLQPVPLAAACYQGPYQNATQCNSLLRNTATSRVYIDDPLTVLTTWPEGDTCPVTATAGSLSCTQGGYPAYVVNATTVKQIQAAVNFARNKNLRLVIKNSGHDFLGRSTGFGSLSIWTHWLKDFEFLPHYEIGEYNGAAARVATGLEAWQMHQYMNRYNVTLVVPGSYTIAPYGGWVAGGGHNPLASLYGLGADQPLLLQVVTADGRFVTASPEENTDLFYALCGGGPSTWGVVTSAVVKAHPYVGVLRTSLSFSVNNPSNATEVVTFWRGIDLYYRFGIAVVDAGGTAYGDITLSNSSNNKSFAFSTQFEMPAKSTEQVFEFVQPLFDDLNAIGIAVTNAQPVPSTRWTSGNNGLGDAPGNSRFGSRLFPRSNFEDPELLKITTAAMRETVEAGYRFHGIHIQPTEAIAGPPGHNAVNPAFRKAIMHADLFDNAQTSGVSSEEWMASYQRFNTSMAKLRAVTPGAGAYINEADVQEPNWQQAFFGTNYARLLEIKENRDPWGLFWAPSTGDRKDLIRVN
ncbi:hypothetical protein TruAng_007511 [Truncatella angustata]|nr:hypothetical protein TruAng_007511 [Truncatella angustata]